MTLATLTISQLWGLSFMALAGGILVAGIVIDIRIAAMIPRRFPNGATLWPTQCWPNVRKAAPSDRRGQL